MKRMLGLGLVLIVGWWLLRAVRRSAPVGSGGGAAAAGAIPTPTPDHKVPA